MIDVPVDEMLIVELYSSKFYVTPMNISCGILFHGILFVRTCQHIKFAKEGLAVFDFERPNIEVSEISEDKKYGKFVVKPWKEAMVLLWVTP